MVGVCKEESGGQRGWIQTREREEKDKSPERWPRGRIIRDFVGMPFVGVTMTERTPQESRDQTPRRTPSTSQLQDACGPARALSRSALAFPCFHFIFLEQ